MIDSSDRETADTETRAERIRQVVNDCIARRAEGEQITDESLIEANPDLMPELADQLRNLRLIEEAERGAAGGPSTAQSPGLRLRCPHCHHTIELVEETSLSDVVCPSCGSHFSLVDEPQTFQAGELESVGHFKLLDKLGAGAFGSVWSARDIELDRQVAIKIPRKGQLTPEDTEKFIREARAAAQLNHPNIVPVYEVGREGDRVYIVADFVHGVNLADWLTHEQPAPREAAELCAKVADALEHAHQHGVIHRDLKPSNIMLDQGGEPHLMDFGLAKREGAEVTMTVDGKLLGTPAYMSPEQAQGTAHDADCRSDVYSLGVVMFELLTGERPFRGTTQMLIHQIVVEDAPSPRRLNYRVPRDLETICLKCLEKDRGRRYQAASELRDDLRRFLRGEPVQARPITRVARGWRWCRRNPAVAGLGASVAALLLILVVAGAMFAVHRQSLYKDAKMAQGKAEEERRNADAANDEAQRNAAAYKQLLYVSDMLVAQEAFERTKIASVVELLERHIPKLGEPDPRGFEWYLMWARCERSIMTPTLDHGFIWDVVYPLDGKSLAYVDIATLSVVRRDAETFEKLDQTPFGMAILGSSGGLSADGNRAVVGFRNGTVNLADLRTGELHRFDELDSPICKAVFLDNDRLIAAAGTDGTVVVWNTTTRQVVFKQKAHDDAVYSIAFSRDRNLMATGGHDLKLKLWDLKSQSVVAEHSTTDHCGSRSSIWSLAFSPDGETLAAGTSGDFAVLLFDVGEHKLLRKLAQQDSYVRALAYSPDGKVLASAGRAIKLWHVDSGRQIDTLRGQLPGHIWCLAFSRDGKSLASGSGPDGELKVWSIKEAANPIVLSHTDNVACGALSHHGRVFATAGEAETVVVWDATSGERIRELVHGADVLGIAFSLDDRLVASAGGNSVKLWDVVSGDLREELHHDSPVLSVAFSPVQNILATASTNGQLSFWDVATGKRTNSIESHNLCLPEFHALAFSPDGKTVAFSGTEYGGGKVKGSVKFWDVANGQLVQEIPGDASRDIAFSSDGRLIACASFAGFVLLWDIDAKSEKQRFVGHEGSVTAVCFSPDDRFLMSADQRTVKAWDVATGQQRFELETHAESIQFLAITKNGDTLITGSGDDTVKLWRAASLSDVGEMRAKWRESYRSPLWKVPTKLDGGDPDGNNNWQERPERPRASQ